MSAGPAAGGVIESILARAGQPVRLAEHLGRLARSVRELYGAELPADLGDQIRAEAAQLGAHARLAIRIHARPTGAMLSVAVRVTPLGPPLATCRLALASRPAIDWSHKWADRASLTAAEVQVAPALPYFLDPAGYLAETSRGTLFVLAVDDVWRTPPLSASLLPGVTRQALLAAASQLGLSVKEEPITPAELQLARSVVWSSSLSGSVSVTEIDRRRLLPVSGEALSWLRSC